MNNSSHPPEPAPKLEIFGFIIFLVSSGFTATSLTGFFFNVGLTLELALICAAVGGAVGGAMIAGRPFVAGAVGGLIAGTLGLLALYFYTRNREQLWTIEIVLVQGVACLPGVLVAKLLQRAIRGKPEETDDQSE